ncbi:phosphoribosylglycinamide formyltransferase [Spizellomyces punctatus DAOM BR117]|uniref:Phosphoribosylglycinamide formyltransferase n=1 Tax=Spizellomyces punctatus (strain DAOM BR117) TaxID=645134 RepID=A0A0L0HUQ7_SPIPD|nr:phosphoribosylglycinamide formyltransferase [Spizellomyces punctatus DAOM BR117]KND05066.1 phosphoribosylglycinamide formyltransferase [Spizellomyces punctatus DAOM BR117]|eukprot:XP_016613105.1 phosphoribosylglycinamide formyltransferase [Spizellomyces punctatus DAOM BR117]
MSTQTKPRIVVLISGNGSNLQAIIDAVQSESLNAEIALVVSNRKGAYGLTRAANAGIPTMTVTLKEFKDAGKTRVDFDLDVAARIKNWLAQSRSEADRSSNGTTAVDTPDLIVLAGWMHILSPDFLQQFPPGQIINLHPALPGAFDGAHAIERAFSAYKEGKIQETGVMVHKVIPEVDRGEVVLQERIPILPEDTLETLEDRIHKVEHRLIVEGAKAILSRSQASR